MFSQFQASYQRIDASLQKLIDSIAAYNPSVAAADELVAADEAVKQNLDDLVRHQQNHLRIQELRATTESLDETIKTTLRLLADARKDISSVPPVDTRAKDRSQQVGIQELLTYAKYIARTTVPPTYRRPGKDDAQTQAKAVEAGAAAARDATARISNGLSTPQAEDQNPAFVKTEGGSNGNTQVNNTIGHKSMQEKELAWLNPDDGSAFKPWPDQFLMQSGALGEIQRMVERGEDPGSKLSKEEQEEEDRRREKAEEEAKTRKAEEERRAKEMFGASVQRRGTVVEGFNPDDL